MEKMRTDQNRLMRMIEPTFARPNSMLPLGGGLTQSGGLSPGGGLMYGNAGNGVAEFGQGYHPELRKIMKADDQKSEQKGGDNEEEASYHKRRHLK